MSGQSDDLQPVGQGATDRTGAHHDQIASSEMSVSPAQSPEDQTVHGVNASAVGVAPDGDIEDEGDGAPRNEIERIVLGVWAEVLELNGLRIDESFLDLGGHSFNGARIVRRLWEIFGVELPLESIIDADITVANMSLMIVDGLAKRPDVQALAEQLDNMD